MSPRRRGQEPEPERAEAGAGDAGGSSLSGRVAPALPGEALSALKKGRVPCEPPGGAALERDGRATRPAEGSAPGSPPFHLAREGGREGGEEGPAEEAEWPVEGAWVLLFLELPPLQRPPRGLA